MSIDRPASAGDKVDHEKEELFPEKRKRGVPADFDVIAIVDCVGLGDFAAMDVERFIHDPNQV